MKETKEEKRERMGPGPIKKEAAREGRAMEAIITLGELILLWLWVRKQPTTELSFYYIFSEKLYNTYITKVVRKWLKVEHSHNC